jgi:RHS repeat-associated protein
MALKYQGKKENTSREGDSQQKAKYDAEGQVCAVQSVRYGAGTVIQYVYDAEGARIGKGTLSSAPAAYATCAPPSASGSTLTSSASLALTTRYLVDLGGEQVTEMSESGGESWQHSNLWVVSRLTATYDRNGLHYELADPLGTKREQVNIAGHVENQWTSLPFGNDLNNPPGYSTPDATEHHFTGKERDTESGNDYFGARYYASTMGRWLSPDWSAKYEPVPYAKLDNPQTLNLYAYVLNNPLTHFDPDGHACDSLWHCAQGFLNAVEVKVSASLGSQGSVQWGVAKAEYHATFAGVEGKSGLGGGIKDASVTTGVGASASASAGPANCSVSVKAEAKASTADGASANISASAKVSLGTTSGSASATMGTEGPKTSAEAGADTDWKVGGSFTAGVGVGGAINFSQLGRAFGDLGDSLSGAAGYLKDIYMPSGAPSGGVPGIPDPQHPFY